MPHKEVGKSWPNGWSKLPVCPIPSSFGSKKKRTKKDFLFFNKFHCFVLFLRETKNPDFHFLQISLYPRVLVGNENSSLTFIVDVPASLQDIKKHKAADLAYKKKHTELAAWIASHEDDCT